MLDFSGGISFGTAKEFETMLKAMDNVRTVRLNSNGGRIAEAQKISDLIKARGLSTYVTHHCASACTIMFLGGKQRHLHASARLGFHQPYFRGMTASEQRISIAREQARLEKFGLSAAFAERANAAGPSGMWFPEQSELLRERVVTSIVNAAAAEAGGRRGAGAICSRFAWRARAADDTGVLSGRSAIGCGAVRGHSGWKPDPLRAG